MTHPSFFKKNECQNGFSIKMSAPEMFLARSHQELALATCALNRHGPSDRLRGSFVFDVAGGGL